MLLYLYFTICYVIDTLYFVTLTKDNVYTWCTSFTPYLLFGFCTNE